MDQKVDNSQPEKELKDSNIESPSDHSDSDPKKEAIAGGFLRDQGIVMNSNSPKESITEGSAPNPSTGQLANTENIQPAPTLMDIDSSHQNSTNKDSLAVSPSVNTVVEVMKLTDPIVKYHISIKYENGEPQVGSVEKSPPSDPTTGDSITDSRSTSSNRFHPSVANNSGAISKEFSAAALLLGKFDEFINQIPLPRDETERENEIKKRIREACGMSTTEIDKLKKIMSVDRIRKKIEQDYASASNRKSDDSGMKSPTECRNGWHRNTLARCKKRMSNFPQKLYCRSLKYSGDKASIDRSIKYKHAIGTDDLRPGETLVYTVRLYKPFNHLHPIKKGWVLKPLSRFYRTGRGVSFQQDFQFLGSQTLCQLRDSIRCPNDLGPQQDLSLKPAEDTLIDLKGVFPSAFLFINNVFYNDMRHHDSTDISEPIRQWAEKEGLANFEHRSMEGVTFDSINIRLGHPELFMHQGECEHLFTISKVRVLQPADICVSTMYPFSTALNPYNSVNCIICTKLCAKWIITGCERIPFDPAFVCGVCFKHYLYIDGKKVGNFLAYKYQMKNMQITDTF